MKNQIITDTVFFKIKQSQASNNSSLIQFLQSVGSSESSLLSTQVDFEEDGPKILQWHIHKIETPFGFYCPNNLLSLKEIYFTKLRVLSLQGNDIQSIQVLAFLKASNLEQLNLCNNKIVSIQSLRKLQSKRLNSLYIDQNQIYQCSSINYFPFEKILEISIQGLDLFCSQINDIALLSKYKMETLWISSSKRIHQKQLYHCLLKKWQKPRQIWVNSGHPIT